jgi:hypothetical protein
MLWRIFKGKLPAWSNITDFTTNIGINYIKKNIILFATGHNVMNLLRPQFINVCNKLDCFFLAGLSSLVYCVRIRSGAYLVVEHLKGSHHSGGLRPYTCTLD